MYLPSALLLLCLASFTGTIRGDDAGPAPPLFCRTFQCPKYQLVNSYSTFEERNYESTRWVSTQVQRDWYDLALTEGFMRLYKYIDTKNSAELKIPMTVPVTSRVCKGNGMDRNITVSFFVPPALENPPEPTNPTVYLDSLPAQTVYVKSFGGFAFGSDFAKNAKSLSQELKAEGKVFNDQCYMTAGYDAPYMLFNRHNEVWFIAE